MYFKSTPTATAHIISTDETRTLCGRTAERGFRFEASDLPSGHRNFRTCENCRSRARARSSLRKF